MYFHILPIFFAELYYLRCYYKITYRKHKDNIANIEKYIDMSMIVGYYKLFFPADSELKTKVSSSDYQLVTTEEMLQIPWVFMTAKCSPHMIVTMMKLPLVAIVLILLKEVGGITGQYITYALQRWNCNTNQ